MGKRSKPAATLSPEQKKEIVDLAVEAGINAYRSEAGRHQREIRDKRLRNTKLLMRNYRDLKEHTENAVFDAASADDESVDEVLDLMSEFVREEASTIDSIKKSVVKTRLIMDHVDEMLSIYQSACERSRKPEDLRKFNILFDYYISPENLSIEEIAEKYSVEERTVYRDLREAIARVTALMFGVEGIFRGR